MFCFVASRVEYNVSDVVMWCGAGWCGAVYCVRIGSRMQMSLCCLAG